MLAVACVEQAVKGTRTRRWLCRTEESCKERKDGSSEVRLELTGTGTSQMAAQINRANLGAGITACALIFGRRGIFFIYLYIFIIYNTIYYCSRSRLLCRSCSRASRRSNRSTTSPSSSSATLHQPAARSSTVAYASASLPSTSCAL